VSPSALNPHGPPAAATAKDRAVGARPRFSAAVSWTATTFVLLLVGFVFLLLLGVLEFGSVAGSLAYLRRDREPPVLNSGSVNRWP
jgi:hypothetical protein